jgi:hypothetical protein
MEGGLACPCSTIFPRRSIPYTEGSVLSADTELYAVAYRPAHRGDNNQLDPWPVALAVGQPLPLLPLALRGAFFVPVDLEATYVEARQRCRL